MNYDRLLDLATDLGYELAMCGAETYRVEESISRILGSYDLQPEVFVIPNCMIASIETPDGQLLTRMRRIGYHGNDLDGVERFSALSRAICNQKPDPEEGHQWLNRTMGQRITHAPILRYLGYFLGAGGFSVFFGGTLVDCICGGICGMLVGLVTGFLDRLKANQFFSTIAASFLMSMLAYTLGALSITPNPDHVIIGALMILVPGLLFTNAMRDIIYGDTNSGVNRIVQVLLVSVAIALGTAAAWSIAELFWGAPINLIATEHPYHIIGLASFIGCVGFSLVFNIHGPGIGICALGGLLTWVVYAIGMEVTGSELMGYLWGAVFAGSYSEIMARIRKFPAIAYLVVSIFPLIPGAGVYYTVSYALQNNMEMFVSKGMYTAAIAGLMAVGILLVSTSVRLWSNWKLLRKN